MRVIVTDHPSTAMRGLRNIATVFFTSGVICTLGTLAILILGEVGVIRPFSAESIPYILLVTVGVAAVGYILALVAGNRKYLTPVRWRERRR